MADAHCKCAHCGAEMPPKLKLNGEPKNIARRYCSEACRAAHRGKRSRNSKPRTITCQHCFCECVRRVRGGEADSGKYCDRTCAAARRSLVAREIAGIKRLVRAPEDVETQRRKAVRSLLRELRALARHRAKVDAHAVFAARPCLDCGGPCGYTSMGMPRTRCPACAEVERRRALAEFKQSDAGRRARRVAKSKRRALIRSTKAEAIDPLDVFDRDGWRCHLCRKKTPQALRGTIDDRAPELDHIVSLADGGSHTWSNVACACRACNRAKGARSIGQLLLA